MFILKFLENLGGSGVYWTLISQALWSMRTASICAVIKVKLGAEAACQQCLPTVRVFSHPTGTNGCLGMMFCDSRDRHIQDWWVIMSYEDEIQYDMQWVVWCSWKNSVVLDRKVICSLVWLEMWYCAIQSIHLCWAAFTTTHVKHAPLDPRSFLQKKCQVESVSWQKNPKSDLPSCLELPSCWYF